MSPADAVAVLKAAGLGKWVKSFLKAAGPGTNVFTLKIQDGNWTEFVAHDGGTDEAIDVGTYAIDGQTVAYSPGGGPGTDTFRWSVDGNMLTLTWVGTSGLPPSHGIPEEVYQRAGYTAAPFERQS